MEEGKIKKVKLSIYLIKGDYSEVAKIVPKNHSLRFFDIKDRDGFLGTVFVDTGFQSVPKWAEFLVMYLIQKKLD